jgi:segregation and condensation protein B
MAKAKKKSITPEDIIAEMNAEAAVETTVSESVDEVTEETVTQETAGAVVAETAEDVQDIAITQEDVRLVEAILFASSSSVSTGMIAERFPEDRVRLIPDILEILREQYAARGVTLVQRDNRWALRTASDLGDQLRLEKEQPKKFTRAAMETMAIIAYHQPVTRAEIENIRGVATSPGALDALMEAGWIKPGKRREVPGRPVTWLTTQSFLDHFGLEKLEDLPGMDELKAAGLLDKRPAIEAMPTADLFGDAEDKEAYDPQEVTDEDLIGRADSDDDDDFEDDTDEDTETTMSGGDEDEDDEDEDDSEDGNEEDSDEEDSGDEDDESVGDDDEESVGDDDEESVGDDDDGDEDDEDSDDEDDDEDDEDEDDE